MKTKKQKPANTLHPTVVESIKRDMEEALDSRAPLPAERALAKMRSESSQESADAAPAQPLPTVGGVPEAEYLEGVAQLIKVLNRKLMEATYTIDAFKERLAKNPADAMENSSKMFEQAARQRIYTTALKPLTGEDGQPQAMVGDKDRKPSIGFLRQYATEEVMRRARYASQERSTSPTYNLMEREYLAAWGEVIEMINWHTHGVG